MVRIRGKPKDLPCTDVTLFMPVRCCCGRKLGGITRDIWVPDVVLAYGNFQLDLPDIDTERLRRHKVYFQCQCMGLVWDYGVNRLRVNLLPLAVRPDIAEETMALLTGVLREARWKNTRNVFATWRGHRNQADTCDNDEDEDEDEDEDTQD